MVGSFTSLFVVCECARWRSRSLLSVLYFPLPFFAVAAYRLFWVANAIWSHQRRLLEAYYRADKVLSCGGGNFYADRAFSPFFICSLLTLAFALGLKNGYYVTNPSDQ